MIASRLCVAAGVLKKKTLPLILGFLALAFPCTVDARGDKVIPQIADGAGRIRTKIDIHNLSSTIPITKVKLYFFQPDGSRWFIATNLGTADEFVLDVGKSQTLRVETMGTSGGLLSGYAILRDREGNSPTAPDYQIAVSVFYEVLEGSRVVDTVSVPLGEPCLRWVFPVQIDVTRGIHSGFAIVNLTDTANRVTFKLWTAFQPSTADAADGGTVELLLKPGEQRARFLSEPGFFPQYPVFRGVLAGTAEKPVAVLGLLQTQALAGVQYATLAAAYTDDLHNESCAFLPQGSYFDVDDTRVPFVTLDDSASFDLWFQAVSSTVRNLVPRNGATVAFLGMRTVTELNNLTLEELQAATYSTTPLEISEHTGMLAPGFTLAIKTSKGRFAKLRIDRVISTGEVRDIIVQVYIYR
jgi:hypothetical protein